MNSSILNKISGPLTSPKVTLWLFALILILLVPSTFYQEYTSLLLVPVKALLALVGLNLAVCTLNKLGTLRKSTLVIHLGVITILVGSLISAFGFVATVNVYEGTSIDNVFRWDTQQDVPLGFDLHIARINVEFYPVAVKIGVLKNGNKADLIVTSTDDSFVFENYRVKVLSLDPGGKKLQLVIETLDGTLVGTIDTSSENDISPDFPLDFKLVAFQDPQVKRMWVDLELFKKGKVVVTGTSEVNHPFSWQGMKFFLTQVSADNIGKPYAGIQISRDPGIPYIYCGFFVLCLGLLSILKRWLWNE